MTTSVGARPSGLTVIGLLAAIYATDFATNRFEPRGTGLVLKALLLFGFLVWARGGAGLSWAELGLDRGTVRAGLRTGLVAMVCIAVAIAALVAIVATRSYFASSHVLRDSTAQRVLQPLVVIPLGTVLFEETIFRGVLLGVLLRRGTPRSAVMISSVAFGFWHLVPMNLDSGRRVGEALGVFAVTTVAGVLFAWLRLRSGSLLAPILAHVGTNSFAFVGALATPRS